MRRCSSAAPPRIRLTGGEALEIAAEHFRLLRIEYRSVFGPKASLPSAVQAAPPHAPAILATAGIEAPRLGITAGPAQRCDACEAPGGGAAVTLGLKEGSRNCSRSGMCLASR
jgi:hypothetical protein